MRLKNLQEVFESLEKKNLKKSQYALPAHARFTQNNQNTYRLKNMQCMVHLVQIYLMYARIEILTLNIIFEISQSKSIC